MDKTLQQNITKEFVERETSLYDTLYFYGERQKVHLLIDAITKEYTQRYPSSKVLRTNADDFRKETIEQIVCEIHYYIPSCDLYIFENIDAVAGMEANEQRLYGVLDWLLKNKRQIIISGSVPTKRLWNLAPRICAQIAGGIALCVE